MNMDYGSLASEALEMLAEVGGPCVLIQKARTEYDPRTASADLLKPKRTEAVGVRIEYSLHDREGSLILDQDCKLLLGAVNSAGAKVPQPASGDDIAFAGTTYQVIHCKPTSPAGVPVLYEVQARVP